MLIAGMFLDISRYRITWETRTHLCDDGFSHIDLYFKMRGTVNSVELIEIIGHDSTIDELLGQFN